MWHEDLMEPVLVYIHEISTEKISLVQVSSTDYDTDSTKSVYISLNFTHSVTKEIFKYKNRHWYL